MQRPRFFITSSQVTQPRVILSGSEFHHLRHVLRLSTGNGLLLRDDTGHEYQGTIVHLSPTRAEITITAPVAPISSPFSLTLVQGMLKRHKMDLVIEKVTELGVSRIVPFFSTFTVAQLPQERREGRLSRWQRLAQSAAKQSGSPVPLISAPQPFRDILATVPDEAGKVLCYEKATLVSLKAFAQVHSTFSSVWVVIGPEGGFAAEEIAQAEAAGFQTVSFGTRIIRSETASIVAVALSHLLWGEAQAPPLPSQEQIP